ncbi:MAG: hypothetical protein E3J91_01480 [Hadesarchaea archaeon]|nr:MAG: hypothetical protein E3J91_01480 [Hadesarchaea archaeon]
MVGAAKRRDLKILWGAGLVEEPNIDVSGGRLKKIYKPAPHAEKVLLITGRGHVTNFSKRMSKYNVIFLAPGKKLSSLPISLSFLLDKSRILLLFTSSIILYMYASGGSQGGNKKCREEHPVRRIHGMPLR